jgi:uncharacterized ParB-like nuclease family protein
MKIKFLQDSEVEVVIDFNMATDEAITEDEMFKAGEIHDVDVLTERRDTIDIQFGCGDCCYGLKKSCFEIVERSISDMPPD